MWIRLFTFKGNLDLIFSRFCVQVSNCKNIFWSWSSIELACCRQQGNKLQSNPCGHFHPIKIHPWKCPDCYTSVWHHYGKGPYWHRPFFLKRTIIFVSDFCFPETTKATRQPLSKNGTKNAECWSNFKGCCSGWSHGHKNMGKYGPDKKIPKLPFKAFISIHSTNITNLVDLIQIYHHEHQTSF